MKKLALEVEAALIDAYSGTLNSNAGHDSEDRGMIPAQQVIKLHQAKEIDFQHKLLMISVNRSITGASASEADVYEAVRGAWKLDVKKAQKI